jgi:hypothetical protein
MIGNDLSSVEERGAIKAYLATPQGRKAAEANHPLLLEGIDVPDEVRITSRSIGRRP